MEHPKEVVAALPDVDDFAFGALAPEPPKSSPRLRAHRTRPPVDDVIDLTGEPACVWDGVYYVRDVGEVAA